MKIKNKNKLEIGKSFVRSGSVLILIGILLVIRSANCDQRVGIINKMEKEIDKLKITMEN